MRNELNIRISGEAGQGVQTIGFALCEVFKNAGFYVFSHQDYMSRIRGGYNFYQIRVSTGEVFSPRNFIDVAISLNDESVKIDANNLTEDGLMILDNEKYNLPNNKNYFNIPFYRMAKEVGKNEIFVNSICCGAVCALIDVQFKSIEDVLLKIFGKKDENIISTNIKAAREGFEFLKSNFKSDKFYLKANKNNTSHILIDGNEAIGLAAIAAGCKFYTAYPMTPSTGVMLTIAENAREYGIVVEQAEDEIAAVNMAIGASFAGVRSMTGTSGGGFALMTEGVSLAAMTETPLVIVVAQRPAPATGFPTRTEQADLDFVLHSGHGEFARAIFAPGSIEEAFYLTAKAFNLAEKYQTPVFILTDQHLADSIRNIPPFDLSKVKIERNLINKTEGRGITEYKRYKLTDTGISPRAIPSWINDVIYVDSDEHSEEGHITEDAQIRKDMVEKRFYKKYEALSKEVESPKFYNLDNAKLVMIGFGSNYGVIKEVCERNKDIGFVHLSQVWPLPIAKLSDLLSNATKIITVENNAGAQLAKLIKRETNIKIDKSVLKYDGRPFTYDQLMPELEKEV